MGQHPPVFVMAECVGELAGIYKDNSCGHPLVLPVQLALSTTILQAYSGSFDDETIEVLTMDRRWQMVLDCPDCEEGPFGKATLLCFAKPSLLTAWTGDG